MITNNKRIICLFFYVHQPFRLKTYRFFNIGYDHYYYDDHQNRNMIKSASHDCYMPANEILMTIIKRYPEDFKVSFGISSTALEQLNIYASKAIDSFRELYETGNVEFVAEPFSSSLAMLTDQKEYRRQIKVLKQVLKQYFGGQPKALVNTNLVYSNVAASIAHQMGFNTVLTDGSGQALGWKSSDYLYYSELYPDVKLILRKDKQSNDITFRFSMREWNECPLIADKFISWLNTINPKEKVINLFIDYGTMGIYQNDFMNAFVEKIIQSGEWCFKTFSEVAKSINSVDSLNIREAISLPDRDINTSAWLGNELQQEAFKSLYSVAHIMEDCIDNELVSDWNKLQTCDHFYYMSTKYHNDGAVQRFYSPYSSPYEAFVNYMNVLSDFLTRVLEYENQKAQSYKRKQKYQEILMTTI